MAVEGRLPIEGKEDMEDGGRDDGTDAQENSAESGSKAVLKLQSEAREVPGCDDEAEAYDMGMGDLFCPTEEDAADGGEITASGGEEEAAFGGFLFKSSDLKQELSAAAAISGSCLFTGMEGATVGRRSGASSCKKVVTLI